MGRNSGSQIMWTHLDAGTSDIVTTFYCQQHAAYNQKKNNIPIDSISKLKSHLETEHGCTEQ